MLLRADLWKVPKRQRQKKSWWESGIVEGSRRHLQEVCQCPQDPFAYVEPAIGKLSLVKTSQQETEVKGILTKEAAASMDGVAALIKVLTSIAG